MATTSRKDLPGTNAPNWSQRVTEELRVLMGRGGNGRALTAKDLIDSGIAKPGAGGGLVPGVPGGGDIEPDLTPPPVPTGFAVTAGLTTVFVEHDAPGYTQGHGHDRTVVYGVLQTGSTAPTFDQAVVLFQFQGTIGAYPAALGTRYRLWIKWQSQDGVQSVSPAGGTNGLDVQTGKIGNNDLGPLIVEAGNLANGSVSASKLAAQAVDATKFANGIEPVSVSTAATLPTVKSTSTIVWQGKLYRWDGSKYTAAVPTVDLTGTIIASQIAAGAVDVTKFASGIEPVTNSAAASLPTVKTTTVITWQGKLYRWDGSKYTAEVAVVDLAGQIDAAKLADNAVTVSKIAAGAVEAGKLAAGAVTADKIAAAAVDATKFASGIEPVTNSAAASLPTVKSTTVITWQGKLYRWDGSKYSAEVAAVDLTGQIDSTKLADNAVTVSKIAAGAVDAGKLASGAVTTDKIAAAAVDVTKFASGIEPVTNSTASTLPTVKSTTTITWQGKLYRWDGTKYTATVPTTDLTGSIIASQIAAGAVDATKFASGIEPVSNSTAGTLPTVKSTNVITWQGKLYRWDGAKYSAEVAVGDMVGQIAATQIADNAITTPKLAANSVAAGKIAANAVTANTVAADAITAGKIAAGAVNTRELAAGSVTAGKLVVTATDAVNVDPFFQDADMWANANFTRKSVEGAPGPNVLAATIATSMQVAAAYRTPIDTSKTYLFETWFIATAAQTNRAFASIRFYDVNGVLLTGADAPNPGAGWPGTNASSGNFYFPAVGAVTPTTWTRTALTVGPNGVAQFPAKAAYFTAGAYLNYGSVAPIVESQWGGFRVTEMARGELIVDGAVTANSIAAGAVTAGKIAANAVTANEIAANSITTAKIQAGAVTTAELAAGAVTASKMVITDPSTLVPDADYSDALMWAGGQGGTINIVTTSNREYNTLDNRALQLNRVQTGTDWDSAFSSKFSLRENTGYRIRTTVYVPAACTFKVRLLTYDSANASGAYKDIDVVATGAGWHSLEDTFTSPGNAAGARALVYIHETSTAAYLRMGKFYVQERTTASLIVDGTITAAKITAKTITAAEIAAGTITAAELGANSVTAGKIAAGTVTANELATNSVTAVKIAAGAVTAGKIAANAVTANEIAANAITTAKIAAGAVTAAEVAAGAITASKLAIRSTETLMYNGDMRSEEGWNANITFPTVTGGYLGKTVSGMISMIGGSAWFGNVKRFDAKPGEKFYVETATRTSADFTGTATILRARFNNGVGTSMGSGTGSIQIIPGTSWAVSSCEITAPAGCVDGFFEPNVSAGTGSVEIAYIRAYRMTSGELIVDGAITAAKIAAKTITAAEIAAGAITAAELGANSVTAGKIAAGTVTANELATNSVTAVKIAAGAVTAGKIAANAVTANEIAANAITTAKIAAGAVSATELAAGSVLASKLVVSDTSTLVPDSEYQDIDMWFGDSGGTVQFRLNETNALAGTVSKSVLQINRVTTGTTAYDGGRSSRFAVTPNTDYVLRVNVYSPGASSVKIRVVTLTPADVSRSTDLDVTYASGSWGIHELKVRTSATESRAQVYIYIREDSTAAYLYVGKMRFQEAAAGSLIVDGAIIAAKLATGSVTANAIAANSVTTNAIAANAVTANEIAANAVTTAKIAAGAVSADQIAANAITVKHLTVMDYSNIVLDPFIADNSSWATFTGTMVTRATAGVPANMPGPSGVQLSKSAAQSVLSRNFQTSPGEVYYMSAYVASATTTGLSIRLMLQLIDGTGTEGGNNGTHVGWVAAVTTTAASVTANTWTKIEGLVTVPAGAAFGKARIVTETGTAATGNWFATNFVCRRAASAELIVDGAITATKIAANAIAVGSAAIQDGAIVNAMIGNLSADKINAGTLNAARIAAGTISSSHLAANSVIAGKIAANAVTAGTIAANAVTANQIAAGAITVDKLAAGSITAEKLSVGIGGNLCPDPMFTPGLAFWQYTISHSQYGNGARGVNMNFDYTVPGTPTLFLEDLTLYGQGQPLGTYRKGFVSAPISVIAGERYEASVYAAFHRCHGEMYLEFFDANGTWVGGGGFGVITDQPSGGRSLANFRRTGGFVTAPAGAITARITILSGAQMAGTSWSNYMFLARPFVGRASALQTELSPWSPSSNTSILPDGITTPSISALAGKFGDIEIRPTAGASGCIRVYDSNGTLRVRLGVW
ncbi:hypothetical protein [Comamonas sp. wu1-DMT]|uniref:hypothetical protein n=1 Tax=Comamonas sp. wu1-DMT TaxID=3126390 RepID=UPI0032E36FD6